MVMQFQYAPQHLVRLLQIIVDGNVDLAVRQVASIHFKNFIAKNWSPHDPGEFTSEVTYTCLVQDREDYSGVAPFVLMIIMQFNFTCDLSSSWYMNYRENWVIQFTKLSQVFVRFSLVQC